MYGEMQGDRTRANEEKIQGEGNKVYAMYWCVGSVRGKQMGTWTLTRKQKRRKEYVQLQSWRCPRINRRMMRPSSNLSYTRDGCSQRQTRSERTPFRSKSSGDSVGTVSPLGSSNVWQIASGVRMLARTSVCESQRRTARVRYMLSRSEKPIRIAFLTAFECFICHLVFSSFLMSSRSKPVMSRWRLSGPGIRVRQQISFLPMEESPEEPTSLVLRDGSSS